uniref:Centromere protein P-like n=1 Tax=Crassostrea virginica TaxID=6565 RepID=A0A8B8BGB6_CRAVI|nr:centromere protein P-like [Crassostrea virginica]
MTDIQQRIDLFGEEEAALGQTLTAMSRSIQRRVFNSGISEDIQNIEQEIQELNEAISQRTKTVTQKAQELYEMKYGEGREKSEEEKMKEVQQLQSQLERTKEITGVVVEKYSKQTDDPGTDSHCSVEGSILGNQFSVQCDVDIPQEGKHVTFRNLDVSVADDLLQRLQQPLIQLSDNNAVGSFFSLVSHYSRWNRHRDDTFRCFMQKYPDIVSTDSEEDTVLLLQSPQTHDSLTLCICWSFTLDPLCQFHPDLKLEVIVNKQLLEADKEDVIKEAPQMFQKIVESHGIERGIDAMIKLMDGT